MQKLHTDMNAVAEKINAIEKLRRQCLDLEVTLAASSKHKDFVDKVKALDSAAVALESKMIQLMYTGTGQDAVRYPVRLAERLGYLAGTVATSDFPPTDEQEEVYGILHERLEQYGQAYEVFMKEQVQPLLDEMQEAGIGAPGVGVKGKNKFLHANQTTVNCSLVYLLLANVPGSTNFLKEW